jgi:ubiquinone/menaquinone biosynthesis C-methylase UbiE
MNNRQQTSENQVWEWQNKLFARSIHRTRKFSHLAALLGRTASLTCLEISAGDSVISRKLRSSSGNWTTAVTNAEAQTSLEQGAHVQAILLQSEELPFEANSFDIVVLVDSLREVPNDLLFIRECHRVLKSDGLVIITDRARLPVGLSTFTRFLLGTTPKAAGAIRDGYTQNELFTRLKDGFDIPDTTLFNNDLFDSFCAWGDLMQKISFHGPAWLVRQNAIADLSRYRSIHLWLGLFSPAAWLTSKLEFLPRTQLIIKSKRRIWRERKQPVIKDGRSIAEATINTKIGTDAPF